MNLPVEQDHLASAAGRRAADSLYGRWRPDEVEDVYSLAFAAGALGRLAELMRDAPEAEKASRRGAKYGAESLTSRPYQGIIEQLQNADDLGATEVRIAVSAGNLLIVHNGKRVQLAHVVAMVMPWLTTKDDDPTASGRFGIGQGTLGALGGPIEIHCDPYHFAIEPEGPARLEPPVAIPRFYSPSATATLVRVPLFAEVDRDQLIDFVRALGTHALLFLKSVERLVLFELTPEIAVDVDYQLERHETQAVAVRIGDDTLSAQCFELIDTGSGGRFVRYSLDRPVSVDDRRHHKATGVSTYLGVVLPVAHEPLGGFYDRLPLPIQSRLPFSVSAQFDPDAARSTLLRRRWNERRLADLGDLVVSVALDRFETTAANGWWATPLLSEISDVSDEWVADHIRELMVHSCQTTLAGRLRLPAGADGDRRPLSETAYEELALDGLLTDGDQTALAPGRFPVSASTRDPEGRWRDVMEELGVSQCITVTEALAMFDWSDEELGDREPSWYVRMARAAIDDGLTEALLWKRCILLADGTRVEPPGHSDPQSLVCNVAPESLASRLGLALQLHPDYLGEDENSRTVVAALKQAGVLLDEVDSSDEALEVLAREGRDETIRVSDEQLVALRDAFERLDDERQRDLGPRIGRNIELRGRIYDSAGRAQDAWVSPGAAYLPATIDREKDSFARAAAHAMGLPWVDPTYARILKRAGGRREIGAQRFLGRLGAATAPRLERAHNEVQPYKRDARAVSLVFGVDRPSIQIQELESAAPGVMHLMDDRWCPDLDAVISDIRSDRTRGRQKRGLALIGVLASAWTRSYAEHVHAKAVWGSDGYWGERGQVISTWLARAATQPWLPNAAGSLKPPCELYLPTDENRLAYGNDRRSLVARLSPTVLRSPVLAALRIKTGPSASSLILRLEELRAGQSGAIDTVELWNIYQLLSLKCPPADARGQLVDDVSVQELRTAFSGNNPEGHGLIFVDGRWHGPNELFKGPRIFGKHRAFVASSSALEPLWRTLAVPSPGPRDCIAVLREIAGDPLQPDDRGVVMETMRALASQLDAMSPQLRSQLRSIPLWTWAGWVADRPVYAVEDDAIALQLAAQAAVWRSGFTSPSELGGLLSAIGVVLLRPEDFVPGALKGSGFTAGDSLRRRFAAAVSHLREELIRGDRRLYDGLTVSWSDLAAALVILDPDLTLTVSRTNAPPLVAKADAHMHRQPLAMLLRSEDDGGAADRGGLAVAALFNGDRQKIAFAWESMWTRAGAGAQLEGLVLPEADGVPDGAEPLLHLKAQAHARGARTGSRRAIAAPAQGTVTIKQLKDISSLAPDEGAVVNLGAMTAGVIFPVPKPLIRPAGGGSQATPSDGTPRVTSAVLPPTSQREQLALDAVRQALRAETKDMTDLRAQHGVGADAIDDLKQFYEIKMSSSADIPDEVTLTQSEVERARAEPGFFLAVVSGLERESGALRVRFISDPLTRLAIRVRGDLTLSGIRTAEALEFVFHPNNEAGSKGPEQTASSPP
jgi:hypothetical protein